MCDPRAGHLGRVNHLEGQTTLKFLAINQMRLLVGIDYQRWRLKRARIFFGQLSIIDLLDEPNVGRGL